MIFRFSCGSVTPFSSFRKRSFASTTCKSVLKWFWKRSRNLVGFAFSQQTVVDENARKLISDGFVEDRGDDGRIDSARKTADHAFIADARSNRGNLPINQRTDLPRPMTAADRFDEVCQQLSAVLGMGHFGMELQAVDRFWRCLTAANEHDDVSIKGRKTASAPSTWSP